MGEAGGGGGGTLKIPHILTVSALAISTEIIFTVTSEVTQGE